MQVRGKDLRVLSEVEVECVRFPSADYFDNFERHTSQKVFEGGTNTDAMTLEVLQMRSVCGFVDAGNESGLSEWAPEARLVKVREERRICTGFVDLYVMLESGERVDSAILGCEVDVFTMWRCFSGR